MVASLRNAACEYAERGWHVFPLRPGHKQPITKHGSHDATDDLVQVFRWWQANPEANIAVVGNPSGLVILDVDPRHDGDVTMARLQKQWGPLPSTIEAETGGGGWHYYFTRPAGTFRGKLGDGIDVQDHRYVVAPPSTHPNGRPYAWSVDGHPDDTPLALLPDEWIDQLRIVVPSNRPGRIAASPEGVSPDPLRRILAVDYVRRLTGREADRQGYVQCPFHGGGQERTPSLRVDGNLWACFACEPVLGKRCLGGNCYDLASILWGFPVPPRGADYMEVKARLKHELRGLY